MKHLLAIFVLASVAVLGGCRTPEIMQRSHWLERDFETSPETVIALAREVLTADGYRIQKSVTARSELEALSPIRAETGFGGATQRRIRIKVFPAPSPNATRVAVNITDIEESRTAEQGVASYEKSVRTPAAYDRFFDSLDRKLRP